MKPWVGLLAAFVGLLMSVASASAASTNAYELAEWPERMSVLHFRASNGYRIEVTNVGHHEVSLTASKEKATVTYQVADEAAANGDIDATFPGLGRIRVFFRQVGRSRHPSVPHGCSGEGNLIRNGFFVGTIRFRGERNYASAHLHRARGVQIIPAKQHQKCHFSSGGDSGNGDGAFADFHFTSLDAFDPHGHQISWFLASKFGSPSSTDSETEFTAISTSLRAGMPIVHVLSIRAGSRSLLLSGSGALPNLVTVSPPAPFHGTATYERHSKEDASWAGTISVEFPGTEPIRFAGPRFHPSLCVDTKCAPGRSSSGPVTVIGG